MISNKINEYINNSKVNGKYIKWDKSIINVHITPITAPIENKEFYYSEVERAINIWNKSLKEIGLSIQYNKISTPTNADVIIRWVKVGRVYEGMCKYPSIINGIIKKIWIEIGLKNEHSPKNTTNESIFFAIMHEFGHALGLGHGVEIDDLMYVPHQKNISIPSENDLYILMQIYNKI